MNANPKGDDNVMSFVLKSVTPLLEVFDLPKSIAFYRDVLGFKLVKGDDSWWAMLSRDGATLMLNTAYEDDKRPPAPDAARVSGHADVTLFFWCEDLEAICRQLREKGWKVKDPVITSYGMKQVSIKDPDGFGLCFHCRVSTESTT